MVFSANQINLSWQDNSDNEDSFKIERKTQGGSYTQIATVGANVTSYADVGLNSGTSYCYRVRAYNAGGDSSYSNEACATTPINPPNAPSNLNATASSSSQIDLSWQDNSNNEDGFKIERKIQGGSYSQIATVGANVTSYSNTGLNSGTTCCYRVRAYNAAGNSGYSNESCATTLSAGTAAVFRVDNQGDVYSDGAYYCGTPPCWNTGTGADIAEYINVSEPVEPGDVVELDPEQPGYYRKSREPCSTLVAGAVSTLPGVTMGQLPESPSITEAIPQSALSDLNLAWAVSPQPRALANLSISLANPLPLTCGISLSQLLNYLPSLLEIQDKPLLALMGMVPVKATTENGPIKPGDLLTTSSTPGHAMRCAEPVKCEGAIIGKALESLEEGEGIIKMLVMR